MFQNIGEKIKMLAKVVCWVGIVGCVIGGIVLCAAGAGLGNDELMIGLGVVLMLAGPLASWIGSFVLYGYGELIVRVTEIHRCVSGVGESQEKETSDKERRIAKLTLLKEKKLISEKEYQNEINKIK